MDCKVYAYYRTDHSVVLEPGERIVQDKWPGRLAEIISNGDDVWQLHLDNPADFNTIRRCFYDKRYWAGRSWNEEYNETQRDNTMRKLDTITTCRDFMRERSSLIDSLKSYAKTLRKGKNGYMYPTLDKLADDLKPFDPAYCEWTNPFETQTNDRLFILEYNEEKGITHFNYLDGGEFHNALGSNGYSPISLLPDAFQTNQEFLDLITGLARKNTPIADFTSAVYMWILKNS